MPSCWPTIAPFGRSVTPETANATAGTLMNPSAIASSAMSDSTSRLSASSAPHASARKATRSSGRSARAVWQRSSICRQRSGLMTFDAFQLAQQPQFRHLPVALDGVARNVQRFGGFIDVEPAEEPHLDDLALALIGC